MKRTFSALLAVATLAVGASAAAAQEAPQAHDDTGGIHHDAKRVYNHLSRVIRVLEIADTSGLTDAQRASRSQHLDVLRGYRDRGVYPHNHDFPGERLPYFIDEHDTACAVGYLVIESGHEGLAREIAAADNQVRIMDAHDPRFLAWADASGFTIKELAMIQPSYDFDASVPIPDGGDTTPDGGDTTPDDSGTPVTDGGSGGSTSPDDGGCSASGGAGSGLGALSLAALALVAVGRRRRR